MMLRIKINTHQYQKKVKNNSLIREYTRRFYGYLFGSGIYGQINRIINSTLRYLNAKTILYL